MSGIDDVTAFRGIYDVTAFGAMYQRLILVCASGRSYELDDWFGFAFGWVNPATGYYTDGWAE